MLRYYDFQVFFLFFILIGISSTCAEEIVLQFSCGGVIRTTSHHSFLSSWSSEKQRVFVEDGNVGYVNRSFTSLTTGLEIMKAFSSAGLKFTTFFQLGNFNNVDTEICEVTINPFFSRSYLKANNAKVLIFNENDPETCDIYLGSSKNDTKVALTPNSLENFLFYLIVGENNIWPINISFRPECSVLLAILTDQFGKLDYLFAWLPLSIYSFFSTVTLFWFMYHRRGRKFYILCSGLLLWFLTGFLLSCVGTGIELSFWRSTAGIQFSFPTSVLFFFIFTIFYSLLLASFSMVVHMDIAMMVFIMRLQIFCLIASMCITFFYCGFVLLGFITFLIYVFSSVGLSIHFSYSLCKCSQKGLRMVQYLNSSWVWSCFWCPISSIFGPLTMFWFAFFEFGRNGNSTSLETRSTLYFFFLQSSFLSLIFHNFSAVSLFVVSSIALPSFSIFLWLLLSLTAIQIVGMLSLFKRLYDFNQKKSTAFSFLFSEPCFNITGPQMCDSLSSCNDFSNFRNNMTKKPLTLDEVVYNTSFPSHENGQDYWPTRVERDDDL